MAFEVIPALDVSGGRLVRIGPDGPEALEAFGGDPMVAATAFADAGAQRLHVVDVDRALNGRVGALDLVRAVAALGVSVQASGGLTSASEIGELLEAGASRVVLGSAALVDRDATEALLAALGEGLVLGIEADGHAIRPRGSRTELPLWDTLLWLGTIEVPRFLFTEVGRAGALGGPDLDGIWALATHTGRPVLAAGGVRSLADLRDIAALGGPVEGAVVGRALYEGLDVREALAAAG